MKLNNINVGDVFANYKELCTILETEQLQGANRIKQMKEWEKLFEWEKQGHKITITHIKYSEGNNLPFIPHSTFNSYKDLCEVLGEKVKTGNSKKAQLKHWENYFLWEREGNKYHIKTILNTLFVNSDKVVSNGKTKSYIPLMEKILLNLMYEYTKRDNKDDNDVFTVTASFLREALGLVNSKYQDYNQKNGRLAHKLELDSKVVEEFYSRSRSMFKRDIERVLKSLKNQRLLEYEESMYVVPLKSQAPKFQARESFDEYGDKETTYEKEGAFANSSPRSYKARPSEIKEVNMIAWKTIQAMGYKDISTIHANGLYPTFQKYFNENIINEMGLYRIYYAYELIFHDAVVKYLANIDEIDFILSKEDLKQLRFDANSKVCDTIINNAKNRVFKANSNPDAPQGVKGVEYNEDYMDSYDVLTISIIKE